MPLTDPGDGGHTERPTEDEVGQAVDGEAEQQPWPVAGRSDGPGPGGSRPICALDGGVSRRLVRRCRTAALILLVFGAAFLLGVAVAPWGVVSALLSLAAAILIAGSLLLVRRGALWSAVAASSLPGATPDPANPSSPRKSATFDAAGSPAVPGAAATVGPPQPLSPGVTGAPVKRRLSSSVVPIYAEGEPSPGAGALVVHARADGLTLVEGDTVLVWLGRSGGLITLHAATKGGPPGSAVRGRFVLYREADDEVFLATTRLTDTW